MKAPQQYRVLRLRALKAKTGLSTTTIYDKMSKGEFPRPIPLGVKAVGWLEHEIDAYLEKCLAARDAGARS